MIMGFIAFKLWYNLDFINMITDLKSIIILILAHVAASWATLGDIRTGIYIT